MRRPQVVVKDSFDNFIQQQITVTYSPFNYTANNSTITISDYTGSNGAVTIPPEIDSLPVTSIGDSAFAWCTSLTSVTIPNGVTSIEDSAFAGCTSLIRADFLGNAPNMGAGVFDNCAEDFRIYYVADKSGFTLPTWYDYRSGVLIPIVPGWNLISLPLEPVNPAVGNVMSDGNQGTVISGAVWQCATDGTGAARYEAATEMHALVGYWVFAPAATTIPISGTSLAASQALAMHEGWNLIGPTAEVAISANPSLAGALWWWDASARQYKSIDPASDVLTPGRGYWLYATQPVDLDFGR